MKSSINKKYNIKFSMLCDIWSSIVNSYADVQL